MRSDVVENDSAPDDGERSLADSTIIRLCWTLRSALGTIFWLESEGQCFVAVNVDISWYRSRS
jgi:hypothetical protein